MAPGTTPLTQGGEGPGGEDPSGRARASLRAALCPRRVPGERRRPCAVLQVLRPQAPPPVPAPAVTSAPASLPTPALQSYRVGTRFPSSARRFQLGPVEGTLLPASRGLEDRIYTCTLTHAHTQAPAAHPPLHPGPSPLLCIPRGEPRGARPGCGERPPPPAAGSQASPASLSHALFFSSPPICSGEGA